MKPKKVPKAYRTGAESKSKKKCIACNGSGKYDHNGSPPCSSCNGTGYEMEKKKMSENQINRLKKMRNLLETRVKLQKKINESRSGPQIRRLLESDLEKAEVILSLQSSVQDLQDLAEKVAKMQIEDVMALADEAKAHFDSSMIQKFESEANQALSQAVDAIRSAKDVLNNFALRMDGKDVNDMSVDGDEMQPETNLGPDIGGDEGGEMDLDLDLGDEFGGVDAATGDPDQTLGRTKKESVQNKKRILESTYKFQLLQVHSENRHSSVGFANDIDALKKKVPEVTDWKANGTGGFHSKKTGYTIKKLDESTQASSQKKRV